MMIVTFMSLNYKCHLFLVTSQLHPCEAPLWAGQLLTILQQCYLYLVFPMISLPPPLLWSLPSLKIWQQHFVCNIGCLHNSCNVHPSASLVLFVILAVYITVVMCIQVLPLF